MTARTLELPQALASMIEKAARRAFPRECCGLIEGCGTPSGWRAAAIHETANLADAPESGFFIDPQVQFERLRALRGTSRSLIGCFHSHPNGRAEPSQRDRREAAEDGFLWLIAAGRTEVFVLNAYVFDAAHRRFQPVRLQIV